MTENKLDYPKEVADMESLITVLKEMVAAKTRLQSCYERRAAEALKNDFETHDTMTQDEWLVKSYNLQLDVFQLNAEIEMKEKILDEFKKRADEDSKSTEELAKQAKVELPAMIKIAKVLSETMRVPKDIRAKLKNSFIDPYKTRYQLKGFGTDDVAAKFYKALGQLIEEAEASVSPKK